MKKTIYVTQPFMPPLDEFIPYLEKIWDSHILTNNGEFHQELEDKLCKYLGIKYISLFSNGTLALVTALQALRITGEVITTPYSFVATTHALWWNNINPVFVDMNLIRIIWILRKSKLLLHPKQLLFFRFMFMVTPVKLKK